MRWVTYRSSLDAQEHVALVEEGRLSGLPMGTALVDLIGGKGSSLADAAETARSTPFEQVALEEATLLAPIPRPPSVRDFMAFDSHYRDTREGLGLKVEPVFYEQPCFYFSNPAAVVGPNESVPIAPGSQKFDFELEVAAIVGTAGRDLTLDNAEEHVAGYTIFCDWSARDLQAKEAPIGNGAVKAKDTVSSLGPFLVTPDELEPYRAEHGYDLAMTATVNGRQWSSGNWNSMYWSMAALLVFASRGTELRPGDVVGTGTVGTGSIMELAAVHGEAAYPWLAEGDQVVLEVEQLGQITGTVVPGSEPVPFR